MQLCLFMLDSTCPFAESISTSYINLYPYLYVAYAMYIEEAIANYNKKKKKKKCSLLKVHVNPKILTFFGPTVEKCLLR